MISRENSNGQHSRKNKKHFPEVRAQFHDTHGITQRFHYIETATYSGSQASQPAIQAAGENYFWAEEHVTYNRAAGEMYSVDTLVRRR